MQGICGRELFQGVGVAAKEKTVGGEDAEQISQKYSIDGCMRSDRDRQNVFPDVIQDMTF